MYFSFRITLTNIGLFFNYMLSPQLQRNKVFTIIIIIVIIVIIIVIIIIVIISRWSIKGENLLFF